MSQTHDEIRALRVMVEELRAEPPPELPWDAIEKSLLARLGEGTLFTMGDTPKPLGSVGSPDSARGKPLHTRRGPPRAGGGTLSQVLGFAAAAAAIAFGVGSMSSSGEMPAASAPARHVIEASTFAQAPGQVGGQQARDLSQLRPGDVVQAGDASVTFAQAGLVTWTLAPGSTARVRSTGVGHTLALERGSLSAEVTPRDPAEGLIEAFAVEVAGTRVAVHGTAFSVSVQGNRLIVDVDHGAVAVGPVGHVGATTGHLLVGPSRASFSLDGGRSARLLDRTTEPVAVAAVEAAAPALADLPAPRPGDSVTAPPAPRQGLIAHAPATLAARPATEPAGATPAPAPAAEPPRLTADVVRARLARCFKQAQTPRDPGDSMVVIEPVTATLLIDVKPDGSLLRARFDRQLKVEYVSCAGGAVSGLFPEGVGHLEVPITFQP